MTNNLSSNHDHHPVNEEAINRQRVFWASIIFTVVALISFAFSFFLIARNPAWQSYVISTITFVALVVDVYSVILVRHGRLGKGLRYLFWSTLFTVPPNVLLVSNTTPILIAMVLTVGGIHLYYLQPRSWRKRYQFAPIVASVLMLLVEALRPSFRMDVALRGAGGTSNYFGPFILAFLVVSLIGLIVRQAWSGSLRVKLLSGITALTVVSVAVVITINYYNNRANLTASSGAALKTVADSQAVAIGNILLEGIHNLQSFGLSKIIQDAAEQANASYGPNQAVNQNQIQILDKQWRAADAANNDSDPLVSSVLNNDISSELREFRDTFPENVEVFVTDKSGANIAATNRTSDYYQADEEWWQAAYNNGKGAIYIGQPEYDQSSKTFGLNIAVPLYVHGTHNVAGVLRTTFNINSLLVILNAPLLGGTAHTDLYLPGNQALAPEENTEGLRPADPEALKHLDALTSDTAYDTFTLDGVQSVVSAAPISSTDPSVQSAIQNLGWVLIVDQSEADYLAPVQAQTRSNTVIGLIILFVSAILAIFLAQLLSTPIIRLTAVAEQISSGDLGAQAKVETKDELGKLASTFNTMTTQLRDLISSLEDRVAARTRNLELAAQVGRAVSQVRALDVMLRDAAVLIREQFDLYYVQVYLLNPSRTYLELMAGTGEVGEQLLARNHRLPFNTRSVNGRAAKEQRTVAITNTSGNLSFKPNPLLPETKSEMAVPLLLGDQVVGVLDLQSKYPDALNKELIPAFEALAGQLAIATQNANLLNEAERAQNEVKVQIRKLARANWRDYLDAVHKPENTGFVFNGQEILPLSNDDAAVEDSTKADDVITIPIEVTGEAIGELEVEGQLSKNNELANFVAQQVAQHIESLRLLDSAERYRAEAERTTNLQTVEGWKKYLASRNTDNRGYMYDSNEVRPQKESFMNQNMFALPLKIRDEIIGNLSVQGMTQNDQESIDLVNAVADRLSAHIENLRLLEETRISQIELDKRAKQLAAVAEVSTASSQELEMGKLLTTVARLTQRQFNLYHAHIFVFDEMTSSLDIVACGWEHGNENEGTHENKSIPLNQQQSLVARAARSRRAVIVNDVKKESGWLPNPLLPNTGSEMAVPLIVGDQVLGVLDIQSDRLNAFSEEDASIQTTLASQVATAMQNARSFVQAQQQAEHEARLNVISQKIQSATTVDAVLQIAARELGHTLGAPITIAQLGLAEKLSTSGFNEQGDHGNGKNGNNGRGKS